MKKSLANTRIIFNSPSYKKAEELKSKIKGCLDLLEITKESNLSKSYNSLKRVVEEVGEELNLSHFVKRLYESGKMSFTDTTRHLAKSFISFLATVKPVERELRIDGRPINFVGQYNF